MSERPFGHVPGHARHDRLLVARFAVGDAFAGETEQALSLVEQCTECARLADDIRMLKSSIAALPAPARTRNFRLTQAQAEELRGNSLERFLRRLAVPGLAMLRPVAGVALAMGLTMAVVGGGLPLAASAPVSLSDGQAPAPQTTPDAREGTGVDTNYPGGTPAPAAASDGPRTTFAVGAPSSADVPPEYTTTDSSSGAGRTDASEEPQPTEVANVQAPEDTEKDAAGGPGTTLHSGPPSSPDTTRLLLIYGGVSLAMLSFAVLLVAWYARRRLEDPLLR